MDNFDPYNVLLAIATNIPVLLMTAFVLQGHICISNVHAALFHMIKPRRDQGSCHAPKVTIKHHKKIYRLTAADLFL